MQACHTLVRGAGDVQYRLERVDGFGRQTALDELGVDIVAPYLIQLVYGYCDVHDALGRADEFGDAGQNLTVVQLDGYADAQARKYLVDKLQQLDLAQQRVGTHHVGVALVELAVAAFLRAVGTPYRLYLTALERHGQLGAVHHHEACKGYGQVVTQALLGHS